MNIKNSQYLPLIVIGILSMIWGSTWVVIKVGLQSLPPFLGAGWRFLIASVILLIYAKKLKLFFPKGLRTHSFLVAFGLINFFVSYAIVYWAEQYINSGLTSVLFSVMPFYVAFFSIKFLPSEHITFKKMLGITFGFTGVVLIFNDQLHFSHPLAIYAVIAVIIAPAFSALGTIIGKKARANYHTVTLNAFPLFYSSVVFFLAHFIFEQNQTAIYNTTGIFSIFYLAIIGTAVTFVLYFWVLKTVSAVIMSLITFITPPLALIWGWIVLGEEVTLKLIIGMLIIFSGIAIVRKS